MELITDRTEEDVRLRNERGVYGFEDLNRVERAVKAVGEAAVRMDIPLDLEIKLDWGTPGVFPENFPTESQMDRYLGNVRAIRDSFGISAPLPQSMNRLTRTGANNIEKVLQKALQTADRTVRNFIYCGEVFAGEE